MEVFGVNVQLASMGLSMYVLGYGLGPMIWSPLSEIPAIGRNPPYVATFAIFVILLVPTALVDNFPGLIVLRFLLGFFGSPCLATGGASLTDLYALTRVPYVLCLWALAATAGPALGPVISGFSVPAEGWRWSTWEMLWLAGPVFLLFFFGLPETFSDSILLQRARRLRKLTGDSNLKSQSEIKQANLTASHAVREALWRPIQVMILDPSIAFVTIYTALIYGIYYSFFESFPLVFVGMHGFNIGEVGLAFTSIVVGAVVSIAIYWSYTYWIIDPRMRTHGLGAPEQRLTIAIPAAVLLPVGLFMFAWTSRPDIHWIVPIIAIFLFTIGIFIVIQCLFTYLAFSYPMYSASVLAGNDMARSMLATGAIHFSRPLYANLGVGSGTSILGSLTAACVAGVVVLWKFGPALRARSRFTVK